MRLSTLELLAFGRFSGETLRFATTGGAIDIVYGDNEAGKSTSLRAVSGFLYGIPVRTTDDFVHQKPTLRIGAEVMPQHGKSVRLVRRKGAKDTLRDGSDAPISEDVLARMLGGLDRDLFEQMFALSREALVAGANDLLTGSGSLGEALFGASLGLAGINDILHRLEAEAADLFKPGGSVPALNASLRELDELRRRARDLELRPADYLAHESALGQARLERESLDEELRRAHAELGLLERNKQLLPLAAIRAQLFAESAALGDVVILGATAREERLAAQRDLDRTLSDADLAQQAIDTLSAQLELLKPNETLLTRAGEIRALHTEIGAHQKAARDLPGLRAVHRATVAEAEALLAQTHPDRTLKQAAELRPAVAVRTAIAALSEDFVRTSEAKRAAAEKLTTTRGNLRRAREEEASLPALADISSARAVLAATRPLGDIETTIADGEAEHQAADAQLRADLSTLPLFDGDIDDLERLRVPALETVARFEAEYQRIADQRRDLEAERARVEAQVATHRERLKALELTGVIPSEADLAATRAHRDHGWSLARRALEENGTLDSFDFDGEHSLPDAYEISVSAADEVADRLRREADRVAQKAELDAAIGTCDGELAELRNQIDLLDEVCDRCSGDWAGVWEPARLEPLPPVEMRAWIDAREGLVAETASQRKERGRLDGKLATLGEHRAALTRELVALGRKRGKSMTLSALVALAEDAIDEHGQAVTADAKVRGAVLLLKQEERAAVDAADQAAVAAATWAEQWAEEVAKLGLSRDLKPDQVRAVVDTFTELFTKLDTAATFLSRIEGIDRDDHAFAEAAAGLAEAIQPDLAQLAPDQTVIELHRLLDTAQAEAAKAAELTKQLDEKTDVLREASDRRRAAEAELSRLMKAAKCETLKVLELAEEQSASALDLRERLKTIDEQMTQIGAAPAAALTVEVDGLNIVDLDAAIQERVLSVESLNERRRDIDETVGQERALLKEMSGGDDAAEAASAVEGGKANVREQAEQYARLRIAIAILRGQIDKFREESHGPLLDRASYFFTKLTCGEYSGLATGFDERGNVVLLGRRKNGAEITVEQMSEGTRDQLYLALRLATIEQQLDRSEPLPLIVDDLFVNFDDQRAGAGFEALAEIAQKTQVIFFTHHHHLVNLAEKALQPGQWALQELGETASAIEVAA